MIWPLGRKRSKLGIRWEFSAEGTLWRLLPSSSDFFVGEDRDTANKKVSFFCVDQVSGEVRWRGRVFDESWWIGIEAVHENVVVLHEFATPTMPDHQKMYVVDAASGELLWSNSEMRFLRASGNSLIAAKDGYERRTFYEVDLRAGSVIRELETPDHAGGDVGDSAPQELLQFPTLVQSAGELPPEIGKLMGKLVKPWQNVGHLEYLSSGSYTVIGYYEQEATRSDQPAAYVQHLGIVENTNGRICFRDVLCRRALMPVPDGFFGRHDTLYAVKERKSLMAVDLHSEGMERR